MTAAFPTVAFCAVGPDGVIDIDMVRRSAPSAQHAAGSIKAEHWPTLSRSGWRVIPVRIVDATVAEVEAEAVPEAERVVLTPVPRHLTVVMPPDYVERVQPAASSTGKMPLLRLGAV